MVKETAIRLFWSILFVDWIEMGGADNNNTIAK